MSKSTTTYQLGLFGFGALRFYSGGARALGDICAGHSPFQTEGDLVWLSPFQDLQGIFIPDVVEKHSGAQELVPCRKKEGWLQGLGMLAGVRAWLPRCTPRAPPPCCSHQKTVAPNLKQGLKTLPWSQH